MRPAPQTLTDLHRVALLPLTEFAVLFRAAPLAAPAIARSAVQWKECKKPVTTALGRNPTVKTKGEGMCNRLHRVASYGNRGSISHQKTAVKRAAVRDTARIAPQALLLG